MKDANYAPVYCALYPQLAEITRKHGYALAIHGSLGRDMDLICVPWVETPSIPEVVIKEIVTKFALKEVGGPPSLKEHGRMAHTLSVAFGECFIDLSFMPRNPSQSTNHPDLLREAAELIEYATYHDGRYNQRERPDWQETAQKLVRRMADALGRKPYEGFGG